MFSWLRSKIRALRIEIEDMQRMARVARRLKPIAAQVAREARCPGHDWVYALPRQYQQQCPHRICLRCELEQYRHSNLGWMGTRTMGEISGRV